VIQYRYKNIETYYLQHPDHQRLSPAIYEHQYNLEFAIRLRDQAHYAWKKNKKMWTPIQCSWANRGSFVLYPDDVIFVESSISLIASIFLSGSNRYIISAPAARCIKEAGKEISSRKSKIPDQDNTHKEIRLVTIVFFKETSVYFNKGLSM